MNFVEELLKLGDRFVATLEKRAEIERAVAEDDIASNKHYRGLTQDQILTFAPGEVKLETLGRPDLVVLHSPVTTVTTETPEPTPLAHSEIPPQQIPQPPQPVIPPIDPVAFAPPPGQDFAPPDADPIEIMPLEQLKKELDALGVARKPGQKTTTLRKALRDHLARMKAEAAAPPVVEEAAQVIPQPPQPTPEPEAVPPFDVDTCPSCEGNGLDDGVCPDCNNSGFTEVEPEAVPQPAQPAPTHDQMRIAFFAHMGQLCDPLLSAPEVVARLEAEPDEKARNAIRCAVNKPVSNHMQAILQRVAGVDVLSGVSEDKRQAVIDECRKG